MATESAIKALHGQYEDRTLLVTFQCAEGNATATTVKGPRGDMSGVLYAAPIAKGDLVKLSTSAVYTIEKNDGPIVLGMCQSEPIGPVNETKTQSAMLADGTLRTVVVELFGTMIREVALDPAAGAITVGTFLTSADGQTLTDAGVPERRTIALADAAAGSGDTIPVLFGFFGSL